MRVGWGFTPHCPFYSAGITYLGATQPHSPTRLGAVCGVSAHVTSIPMRVGCWWRLGSPDPHAQVSYYATTNTAGDCRESPPYLSTRLDGQSPCVLVVGGSHKAVCFLAFVRLLHLYWR